MSINTLIEYCRHRGLSFELSYSEAEDTFSIHMHGAGKGEDFHARKAGLDLVIEWAISDAHKYYESLKGNEAA